MVACIRVFNCSSSISLPKYIRLNCEKSKKDTEMQLFFCSAHIIYVPPGYSIMNILGSNIVAAGVVIKVSNALPCSKQFWNSNKAWNHSQKSSLKLFEDVRTVGIQVSAIRPHFFLFHSSIPRPEWGYWFLSPSTKLCNQVKLFVIASSNLSWLYQ